MKKSELRQIIKEEIKRVLKENLDPKMTTFFEEAYLYAEDSYADSVSIRDVFRAIEDNYGKVSPGDSTYPTPDEVMAAFKSMPNTFTVNSGEHGTLNVTKKGPNSFSIG